MESAQILVIDDEIGICQAVQRALQAEPYRVDYATASQDGLKKIRAGKFDLVLLDVMMPDVSGIDLIASIHEIDREIVCIIITGFATVELAVRAIKQGAYDFLTKPFSVDDLKIAVQQGLERHRLSLEARRVHEAEAATAQLALEKARLEELDRAKQQFIRLVTHELKAPVAAVEYNLRLIQDGYGNEEEKKRLIERCLLRTREETDLINDLLELGKLQVSEQRGNLGTASLDEALQEVVKNFSEQMAHKRIRLEVTVSDPVPPAPGTMEQFKSLWSNLLGNAVKYTPENGRIHVRLHCEGDKVIGEVSDTGMGIPLEEQAKLFSEFFRATNARQAEIAGTGLGLVIVKRVVEQAGGQVFVESTPGEGSTFRFSLPAGKTNHTQRN